MRTQLLAPLAFLSLLAAAGAALTGADPSPAPASTVVHLTGRVTDADTRTPIAGASIRVAGGPGGALTRDDGSYRLELPGAAAGSRLEVSASRLGYHTATRVAVAAVSGVRLDFALQPAAVALEEVTVVAQDAASAGSPAAAPVAVRSRAAAAPALATAAAAHRPEPDTEAYDRIRERGFVSAESTPLSTFSIDVDRASYSNVRRFLERGAWPPADAVRIEELVNYFPYAYPAPRGPHPVSVTTEVAPAPWRPGHRLLRIGLQAPRVETDDLPPANLVFLIDVSGSMRPADKLPLLKRSLRLLADQLRPRDRVAVVVYAGAAGLVLPSTPGSDRETIVDALERLEAGGSTAGGEGLRLAYDVARENFVEGGNNRIVLATDGDFNVGVSSDAEMVRLVEARRREGTFLTVLGFGTGNLKDSKMEKIADHGNGNYAYIDSEMEARKVLVAEMGGTLLTVARDVKLQVEFNPARVAAYRLIGYENRALEDHEFDDDARDAGDMGAGHSVTALYEVVPVGVEPPAGVGHTAPLRYRERSPRSAAAATDELAHVRIRYKEPAGEASRLLSHPVPDRVGEPSTDLRFAAAVTVFGLVLRDSEHRGASTLEMASRLARGALGDDAEGYRAGFVGLVERARALRGERPTPQPQR